jgi:hypothetical protein
MSIRNWPQAMNQFIILHEDRLKDYVPKCTKVRYTLLLLAFGIEVLILSVKSSSSNQVNFPVANASASINNTGALINVNAIRYPTSIMGV